MSVVVDASVTLAWIYDRERTPAVERVFALVIEDVGLGTGDLALGSRQRTATRRSATAH